MPSGPKARPPAEWLGNCWHQSSISDLLGRLTRLPLSVSFDSRLLTTQPSPVGPGGVGQGSEVRPGCPHRGEVPPITASCA